MVSASWLMAADLYPIPMNFNGQIFHRLPEFLKLRESNWIKYSFSDL
jgi:hypothetical protein